MNASATACAWLQTLNQMHCPKGIDLTDTTGVSGARVCHTPSPTSGLAVAAVNPCRSPYLMGLPSVINICTAVRSSWRWPRESTAHGRQQRDCKWVLEDSPQCPRCPGHVRSSPVAPSSSHTEAWGIGWRWSSLLPGHFSSAFFLQLPEDTCQGKLAP